MLSWSANVTECTVIRICKNIVPWQRVYCFCKHLKTRWLLTENYHLEKSKQTNKMYGIRFIRHGFVIRYHSTLSEKLQKNTYINHNSACCNQGENPAYRTGHLLWVWNFLPENWHTIFFNESFFFFIKTQQCHFHCHSCMIKHVFLFK